MRSIGGLTPQLNELIRQLLEAGCEVLGSAMYLPSLVLWSLLLQVTATWQARYADALTGFHPPWANGACLLVQCEAAQANAISLPAIMALVVEINGLTSPQGQPLNGQLGGVVKQLAEEDKAVQSRREHMQGENGN